MTFPQLLQLSSNTHCSDDRDKIYALLGLSRVTDPMSNLKADYSISIIEHLAKVLSQKKIYKFDETDYIHLLKALNLRWSALKHNYYSLDSGTNMISCNLILSTSFQALQPCTGGTWVKTKDVYVNDILITSPKTPDFYYAVRQGRNSRGKRRWTCVGIVWVSYHACAEYCFDLKAIDCFFNVFHHYHRDVVVRLKKDNTGLRKPYILVPMKLSAAVQLYGHLESRLTHKQRESLEEHRLCSPQASSNNHLSPASTWSPSSVVTTTSLQGNASSRSVTLNEVPAACHCIAHEDTSSTRSPTTYIQHLWAWLQHYLGGSTLDLCDTASMMQHDPLYFAPGRKMRSGHFLGTYDWDNSLSEKYDWYDFLLEAGEQAQELEGFRFRSVQSKYLSDS